MFLVRPPSADTVRRFQAEQEALALTYTAVGLTGTPRPDAPPGYQLDRHSFSLGHGEACFAAARAALWAGQMFGPPSLVRWVAGAGPIQTGQTLTLLVRPAGGWPGPCALIANRVVYTVDEPGLAAFAYGTLPGHAEQGEERFAVRRAAGGAVTFELLAFSRPRHPLARLGRPLVRQLQAAASRRYGQAMGA